MKYLGTYPTNSNYHKVEIDGIFYAVAVYYPRRSPDQAFSLYSFRPGVDGDDHSFVSIKHPGLELYNKIKLAVWPMLIMPDWNMPEIEK